MIYPATEASIDCAINSLRDGNIIVYPTDTLYGFGVDATNTDAIRKLNAIKGRARPLSVICDDINQISTIAEINNDKTVNLINELLPGPYTILLKSIPSNLSSSIFAGSPLVGIRIPEHFFPIEIVKRLKVPLVTTSVNRHDKEPLNDVTQVEIDFPSIDIYEDNDHIPSKSSTIIDLSTNDYKIIRQGEGKFPKWKLTFEF